MKNEMCLFTSSVIFIDGWFWIEVKLILSSDVKDGVERNEPPDGTVVSAVWLLAVTSDSSETWEGNL